MHVPLKNKLQITVGFDKVKKNPSPDSAPGEKLVSLKTKFKEQKILIKYLNSF